MNVNQFMPGPDATPPCTPETFMLFLEMRQAAYRGFASIEQDKGLLQPTASLNTPKGQEMIRMLMFRTIEECVESLMSEDPEHRLEELADAYNYLWSILILDPDRLNIAETGIMLHKAFTDPVAATNLTWQPGQVGKSLETHDIGEIATWLAGDVGDVLRNRAWMQNPQDMYFAGLQVLRLSICRVSYRMYQAFPTWADFARMYIAKDAVLQFRLRSKY